MAKNDIKQAIRLKQFLLEIYPCKKDFELLVIDRKPKTRMGTYVCAKQRIIIYSQWSRETTLEQIAIHEYAHHINITEWWNCEENGYKYEASHGYKFWYIYSQLIELANKKGYVITPYYYGRAGLLFNSAR